MKVNNASLTGESEELLRLPDEKQQNIFESPNVAFFGTACTNGNGVGIVFKTGDATIIGQIASLASSAEVRETTLQRDIDLFIKIVGVIAVGMGILFFVIDIILGYSFSTNIVLMIGIVTGNIPEGLLITLTVTLALAAKRMADVKVLVKNMQSVETLGSTSCICSDKTGTLTQNRMTVSHMFYNNTIYDASTNMEEYRKNPNLERTYDVDDIGFKDMIQAIALGSKATFSYNPTMDEMKAYIAKQEGKKAASIGELSESQKQLATEALIRAETNQPIKFRKTAGDASESGLIKFTHPILDINQAR